MESFLLLENKYRMKSIFIKKYLMLLLRIVIMIVILVFYLPFSLWVLVTSITNFIVSGFVFFVVCIVSAFDGWHNAYKYLGLWVVKVYRGFNDFKTGEIDVLEGFCHDKEEVGHVFQFCFAKFGDEVVEVNKESFINLRLQWKYRLYVSKKARILLDIKPVERKAKPHDQLQVDRLEA